MQMRPGFVSAPKIKPMINIGACLDIPTGHWLLGKHNESILNGGLGLLTGIAAIGNNFKTTLMDYMMLSAMDKIISVAPTNAATYDTEMNRHLPRMMKLAEQFPNLMAHNIFDDDTWLLTDATRYFANEMYEILKQYLKDKIANESKTLYETPFIDPDTGELFKMMPPTFFEVDSFSAFETEDVAKIKDDNELGDSGANTVHMRQGLAKMRFVTDIPKIAARANHYVLLTAHVGKTVQIASGPFAAPPEKKLNYLKHGDKLKGVSDAFFFLMSNCWHSFNATPLIIQKTKEPEYPADNDDNRSDDVDLNTVSLRQLRGKAGMTGIVIEVVVSQSLGVMPTLTEFHYLRKNERYGMSGSLQTYALDILPDVKISRPTIRAKIDENPRLRRAINITSEILQMHRYMRQTIDPQLLCDPKTLFNDLSNMGWNMDMLLDTRGWWTLNNDKHPVPYLSSMDLLRMRQKENPYKPYWADK